MEFENCGMCMIVGKVMMDCYVLFVFMDILEMSYVDSEVFIECWYKCGW